MINDLRAALLVAIGKPGRGKEHGHYQLPHLANVLLAFGGPQPADAAEAVKVLRPLIYLWTIPQTAEQQPYAGPGDAGTVLERVIDGIAHGSHNTSSPSARVIPHIEICLNPLYMDFTWEISNNHVLVDRYQPDPRTPFNMDTLSRLRRGGAVTTIKRFDPEMLQVLGKLWLDTLKVQRPELLAADHIQPENETAAPARAAASRATQDHRSAIPAVDTPETRARHKNAQPY